MFSKVLKGKFVKKLDEALRTGIATIVLASRLAHDQFSDIKHEEHEGCVGRSKALSIAPFTRRDENESITLHAPGMPKLAIKSL